MKKQLCILYVFVCSLVYAEYPLAYIERPFTMPKGTAQLDGALSFGSKSLFGSVGVWYGITDHFQVSAFYEDTGLIPINLSKTITPQLSYLFVNEDTLSVVGSVSLPITLEMPILNEVNAGLPTFIIFGERFGLYLFPYDVLSITFGSSTPLGVSLSFPIQFGMQVIQPLWLYVGTNPLSLTLLPNAGIVTFLDAFPLELGAIYGLSEQLDIYGSLGAAAVDQPGDGYLSAGVSYRFGAL